MNEREHWFLILCRIFGRFKIPVPKGLEKKYEEEIKFLGWNVEPYQIFSTSITVSFLTFFVMSIISYFIGIVTSDLLFTFLLLSAVLFYFLLNYTSFYSKYTRAKASSEIILSIVYMAISMRINQNLEKAVEFAASNLTGPLGKDLKRAIFNIKSGKAFSIKEELAKIAEKWRLESQEFVDAINILKESTDVTKEELERNLKEAISIVMSGTKRRMKDYALKIRTPISIVNAFGILMPLLLMIFLPVGMIFLPEIFRQATITTMYTIVLPSIVYMFLLQNFYSRPYSYHQVTITHQKKYREMKKIIIITISFTATSVIIALLLMMRSVESLNLKFIYSLLITLSIGLSLVIYAYTTQLSFETVSKKVVKYEEELPAALYQISMEASTGKPLEKILESMISHSKTLEISEVFEEIVNSIKTKAANIYKVIFDEKEGVLRKYPSKLLYSCMKSICDISEKGSYFVSDALKSISSYLEDAIDVNKFTDEVLSETTSEMKISCYIFAPLAGGIIVGLMSVLVLLFVNIKPHLVESLHGIPKEQLEDLLDAIGWILNLNEQIPLEYFQIIVGIYVIEVVLILGWFLGEISFGEDEVKKLKSIASMLFISLLIYIFTALTIYGIISIVLLQTRIV